MLLYTCITDREHAPPHFHAEYGEYEITIEIKTGIITSKFPRRVLNAVLDWYVLHKDELLENWKFAEMKMPLKKSEPLE